MTEALKKLITQEAENNYYSFSWDFIQGRISGGLYWVEKMEPFIKWANQTYKYDEDSETWYNRNDGARHFGDVDMEYYTTSELREIYFEQLKKKEV